MEFLLQYSLANLEMTRMEPVRISESPDYKQKNVMKYVF